MSITIKVPTNMFKEVEKLLQHRFWDKERERSNRAAGMAAAGRIVVRCAMNHDQIAWVGPPHDPIRAYVCLRCHAAASEPEIRDRGFQFETIMDTEIMKIFELDLERQAKGNSRSFGLYTGGG